jgi:hypothetical protein
VLLTLFFICFSFHYERAALFLSCFRRKSPALSGKYEQGPGPPVPLDGPAISLFRRNPAPKVRNIFHHTICILPFNLSASPTVNFPPHSPHALKTQSPSVLKPPSPNLLLPATSFLLSSYAASGRRNRAGKATRLRLGDGGGGEAGDVAVRGGEGEDGAGEQAQDGGAQPAPPLGRHQDGPQDPFSHGDVAFSVRLGRLFPTDILAPFFFLFRLRLSRSRRGAGSSRRQSCLRRQLGGPRDWLSSLRSSMQRYMFCFFFICDVSFLGSNGTLSTFVCLHRCVRSIHFTSLSSKRHNLRSKMLSSV